MKGMANLMRREAERAMSTKAAPCHGIVSGYDPARYAAKVLLQPDGQETGFIPIASPWVGNGWGLFCPPSLGDMVDVHFQEDGKGAPYVSLRFYGDVTQPLSVASGEFWVVHQSGSSLKFHNDGSISVSSATGVNVTTPTMTLIGNLIVDGMIQSTGDIIDNTATNANNMASFRSLYDAHRHQDTYSGPTSPPLAPDIL